MSDGPVTNYKKVPLAHLIGDDLQEIDLEVGKIAKITKPQSSSGNQKSITDGSEDENRSKIGGGQRLLLLGRSEWSVMAIGMVALILTQLASMSLPWYFGRLVDVLADETKSEQLRRDEMYTIVMSLLKVLLSSSLLLFVRGTIFNAAGERVVARLRIKLFRAILNQEISFFDANKTGELLSRLSSDTAKLQDAATTSISMFIRTVIGILISLIMMFVTSWKLSLLMCVSVPLLVLISVIYSRFIKKIAKSYSDALSKASNVANESISSIRTCRSFAGEDIEVDRYSELIGDPDDKEDAKCFWLPKRHSTYRLGMDKALGHGGFIAIVGGLGQITLVFLLWYGGSLVLDGDISSGKLISFIMYALNVGISLAVFAGLFASFFEAIGSSTRTFEIIDRVAPPLRGGLKLDKSKMEGRVSFENVSFQYPTRRDVNVLDNFTLEVEANTTVALVGQSGGGKSTVISLLERFYDATDGRICIDGYDITSLDPSEMRLNIGLVSQEPVLFGVSIEENICYGLKAKKDGVPPTRDDIIRVAKMANCHDFISQFPEGYDTLVGERGIKLSGGQKQRVSIARALLIDPAILLLDEATSALDSQSEELVQDAINQVMKGRTVIVVAHRLSTIRNADCIVLLKDHKIVDKGTHGELMGRCDEYCDLVKKQISRGMVGSEGM